MQARRAARRIHFEGPIQYRMRKLLFLHGKPWSGVLINVSEEGARFKSGADLPIHSRMKVLIPGSTIGEHNIPLIALAARAIWTRQHDNRVSFTTGIKFIRVPRRFRQALRNFSARLFVDCMELGGKLV